MRLGHSLLAALSLSTLSYAQYFSEGWKPGQTTTKDAAPALYTPGVTPEGQQPPSSGSPFDLSNILTSGPVGSLLNSLGLNVSQSLNATKVMADLWDLRIPLVHDDNWEELVVNEQFESVEEADKRMWFMIITSTAGQQQQGGISKLVDREFDKAFNQSLVKGDLPDVKWGRIDYLNVTYLTTKWNIWQAPWLVIAKDRGQTLRFYRATQLRLTADLIRDFLKEGNWEYVDPWTGPYAPGGKREFVMHYWALANRRVYDVLVRVPRFVLMIVMGGAASLLMRFMHRGDAAAAATAASQQSARTASKERPVRRIPVRREGTSGNASDAGSVASAGSSGTPKKGSLRARKGVPTPRK